jgi:transcriptional regulator with XRE-family HTH domain
MEKTFKSALDGLLDQITPLEQAKTDAKMMLAARIADAMQAKNWKKKDLLKAVGKDNPSIITKWLSGTDNFTVDTLVELGRVLGISLLNLEEKKQETVVTYHIVVRNEVQHSPSLNYFDQSIGVEEKDNQHLYKVYSAHYNTLN